MCSRSAYFVLLLTSRLPGFARVPSLPPALPLILFKTIMYSMMIMYSRSVKAKLLKISSDTHPLQLIKLHYFKLERFKSI